MGPIEGHMAIHIFAMNLAAPVLAWAIVFKLHLRAAGRLLFPVAGIQIAMIWAWHAPPVLSAVLLSHHLHIVMQASLFLSSLWFWLVVFGIAGAQRWKPIVALLMTSKLFCLLGFLLLFAPRPLYRPIGAWDAAALLADQQSAGQMMLIACPLSYVLAGVVIAGRWLSDLKCEGEALAVPRSRDAMP